MLFFYNFLVTLLAPFVFLLQWCRGGRDRAGERWGNAPQSTTPVLWVHAVSVGEVRAAAILLPALKQQWPALTVVMTTTTLTGARQVQDLFGGTVRHVYLPFDLPRAVKRFLDRVQPRIGIVMETEIWPNLFLECARRQIPLVIASARLSERSARRYRPWTGLLRPALAGNVSVAAQTELDAERYRGIGVDATRAHVVGNVKFDLSIPPQLRADAKQLRSSLGADRPVWVAGSTREHEEEQVLEAYSLVHAALPAALLVLVPRHPQRFAAVKTLLEKTGIPHVTRSSGAPVRADTGVLLVDTLGELLQFYAAADVGFVGGTLVPVGGHNLLEPAALGLPVLTGPHFFNAPEVARLLLAAGAALEVQSGKELGEHVLALLRDPEGSQARGRAGIAVIGANGGAVDRIVRLAAERLPTPATSR